MTRARLSITVPEETWVGAVSRTYPETGMTVLAAMPTGETGSALIRVAGDTGGVRDAMAHHEGITSLAVLRTNEDEALVQFDTTEPLILFSAQEAGLPIEPPVWIEDGEATLELTAPRNRLSALGEALEEFGLHYTVEHISEDVDPETLLTDRQRRVLRTAVDRGYYDTPRECTLTELATELDVAKSTLSEVLHRAEGRVLKQVVASSTDPPTLDTGIGSTSGPR
ncbi:helix-turn-helix domain-containing protein [Halobacteriales archaeon QS_3_64_16]|nr:MAG: helix-turn-helix domain-containing protein [Halobacteriales archaeon QS_3_64_16]